MAHGRLWELAAIADMPSQPTLRSFIRSRPDFPVIEYGGKGVEFLLDLDAAAAFVREHWHDGRANLRGVARASRPQTLECKRPSTAFGNLADLAAIADMPSQPTLLAFIRSRLDFPVIEHGRRGHGYVLDLAAAAAFVRLNWRDNRAVTKTRNLPAQPSPALQREFPGLFAEADANTAVADDRGETR